MQKADVNATEALRN